jgi:hypothetical protein
LQTRVEGAAKGEEVKVAVKKLGRRTGFSFLLHPTRQRAAAQEAGTQERLGGRKIVEWEEIENDALHKDVKLLTRRDRRSSRVWARNKLGKHGSKRVARDE